MLDALPRPAGCWSLTCTQTRGASYTQAPLLDDEAAADEDAAADSQCQPYALLFHDGVDGLLMAKMQVMLVPLHHVRGPCGRGCYWRFAAAVLCCCVVPSPSPELLYATVEEDRVRVNV